MLFGLVLAAAVPITAGLCFVAYLVFCGFVVIKTGGTEGLKDVAVAMRAYKVPLLNRANRRRVLTGRSRRAVPAHPPALVSSIETLRQNAGDF